MQNNDLSDRSERVLFQTSREPLAVCTRTGETLGANPSALQFFGIEDPSALTGHGLFGSLGLDPSDWPSLEEGWGDKRVRVSGLSEVSVRFAELENDRILVGFAWATDSLPLHMMANEKTGEIPSDLVIAALQFKQMYQNNQHLANTDSLTGLANRRSFDFKLVEAMAESVTTASPLSIATIDADHFKVLNDTYGHQVGDQTLQGLAGVFKTCVRAGDTIGRIGGEEFGVLLPGADRATAMEVAERLRSRVESANVSPERVTVSIGVATMNDRTTEVQQLLSESDQALYHSKESGRNRVTHADDLDPALLEAG